MATTDLTKYAENEEQMPLAQLLSNSAIVHRFEMAAGQQAGSVMLNIFNAAAANPEIWKCEPMTVVNAALNAAALHLSISPALGQGCILPYNKYRKNGNDWIVESVRASFVPMKRGYRELAMRTNKYRVLNSFTVREGETWVDDKMTGNGRIEGKATTDKAIGYGAYILLFNGYEATVYMSMEQMQAHVVRYSPAWDKKTRAIRKNSKWDTDFDMMAEGVVLKRVIREKGVISDSDKAALDVLEEEAKGGEIITAQADEITGEIMDSEPEPISPEEAAYIAAKEVKTPGGKVVETLPEGQFRALLDNKYADTEAGKAARAILAWNEIKAKKHNNIMSELGF